MTIVLVMAESFTSNRMSRFGYERPTTQFLQELSDDPGIVAGRGYAAANATRSSLPMFFIPSSTTSWMKSG
jgi:glucan phosphoethanolaminetransferase (alkaline phosphatase superfamily)